MIEIQGYATVWGATYDGMEDGSPCRIERGAIRDSSLVQLWFGHEPVERGAPLASIRGGTLSLDYDDPYGLGLRATVGGEMGEWLREEIASGRLSGLSLASRKISPLGL